MNVDIVKQTCPECHVAFWITEAHQKQLVKSKEYFYCPNKHAQSYDGDTCAEELRKKKAELESAKLMHRNAVNRECYAERRISALKGVVTKLKNKQEQEQ